MDKSDKTAYFNEILADVVKSFYDERGLGARYRLTLVGVDYLRNVVCQNGNVIKDVNDIMSLISSFVKERQLAEDISWQLVDEIAQYIKAKISGCLHQEMCNKLGSSGIDVLVCPIVNMIMFLVESSLSKTCEFAETERSERHCESKVVFFSSQQ